MTGKLMDRTAIVTGGARGSGEAIATRFVAEGATVVIADILDERGEATAERLGSAATYRHCDVSSEDDWAETVAFASDTFGPVQILVNNAAVLHLNEIRDTTVDAYLRITKVNELGTFLGIRSVIDTMTAAGGGSIVNISSIDGHYVAALTSAYSASKFAVRGLTKVAALELGKHGIRVNSICPAAGNMEMVMESLPPKLLEQIGTGDLSAMASSLGTPPVGRHGTPADVANAAVFLASDDSAFFSGADLMLDGGTSCGMAHL